MQALRWLVSIAVIALAGLAGWMGADHYQPPEQSGEERLIERALQFYRASAVFDFETMAHLYTPAQQLADQSELNKKARRWKDTFEVDFDEEHRADLKATAEALKPEDLDITVEGDWALVSGYHDVFVQGTVVTMPVDKSVWVRSGGDWWMYQMSSAELTAYGNPPDFARKVIFKREFEGTTLDMNSGEVIKDREELLKEQATQADDESGAEQ